ncbi:MAG: dTDP-4-dehydrorhamnose reductase [Acidobacteriota bacterium]
MNSALTVPLILGGGGRLGRALESVLVSLHPTTVCATRAEIDITDYFGMLEQFERLQPSLVINCAALADVDRCEIDPDLARHVNTEGAAHVARACAQSGARLIHLSTDQVFDGTKRGPYTEDDPPAPLSRYGASKREGELRLLAELPRALVVRTSWLFGPGGGDFVERCINLARREGCIGGVIDQVACPTYTPDLAEALMRLARGSASGVLHFANTGTCTRFEFACRIAQLAGLPAGLERRPLRWADLDRPARRPANSALCTARYTLVTSCMPRPWEEALVVHLEALGLRRQPNSGGAHRPTKPGTDRSFRGASRLHPGWPGE